MKRTVATTLVLTMLLTTRAVELIVNMAEKATGKTITTITYIEKETGKPFTTKTADLAKFTDQANVSAFAVESVGVLAANGIMSGASDTTLSSANTCPVEQSILLVYRVFNLAKSNSITNGLRY